MPMAKSISIKKHQCVLIFVTGAVCTDSACVGVYQKRVNI